MSKISPELKKPPRFATDADGKPTAVTLDAVAYITLLIRANVTDPGLWPPGIEDGAAALERIRQIETDCIAQHGEFDWERLPEAVQDEYDRLCLLLDELQDTGEWMAWKDYGARTIK
jgi:hypothetical protein